MSVLRLGFVILLSFVLGPLCSVQHCAAQELTVGAVLPLTGDLASGGQACRNGMLLALENLPREDVRGLRVIFEDGAMNTARALSAMRKLRAAEKANVIVTWDSGSALALAPLTEEEGVTLFTLSLDKRVVEGRKHAFNFWVTADTQAAKQLEECKLRRYKKIARVTAIQDGMLSIRRSFDELNRDIAVAYDEEVPTDVRDFRSYIARIKNISGIDAIGLYLFMGQVGLFAKQARELGLNVPLFGTEGMEDLNEIKISDGALVNQWYAQAADPSPEFMELYRRRFPGASLYSAGHCHDAVLLFAASLRSGKTLDEFLRGVRNFEGALGAFSATGDNRFTLKAVIREITANGFVTLH